MISAHGEIQLKAVQGCWQNVHVPSETYIVHDRSVTKLKKITNQASDFHNVLVVDKVRDRLQWGVKGKFVLKWGQAEEASGGSPDEIYWVLPEAADKDVQDIDIGFAPGAPGAPKRWRWRRADISNLLDEAIADLPPLARVITPPLQWSVSTCRTEQPPLCNPQSFTNSTMQNASMSLPPPPPPIVPPPWMPPPKAAANVAPVTPVPPTAPPPSNLRRAGQGTTTSENEVIRALQGTWINILDKSESYHVTGLDVLRKKASLTKTFRFRWNTEYGCIEWGLGKYYLQNPDAVPMQIAVWLPSDGRGRSFSWQRAAEDETDGTSNLEDWTPSQPAMPAVTPQVVRQQADIKPQNLAITCDASQAPPSSIPAFGLVSVGRPPASTPTPPVLQPVLNPTPPGQQHFAQHCHFQQSATNRTTQGQQQFVHQSQVQPSMTNPMAQSQQQFVQQSQFQSSMTTHPEPTKHNLDEPNMDLFNQLVENERRQLHQQQQQFPQSMLQSDQQQMQAYMQQQMQEQQLLHQRRQLEQQQQFLAVMQGSLPTYRVTPY